MFYIIFFITLFEYFSEILHLVNVHAKPFGGVWTVVYVDGTHWDVFLVSAGPDSFHLEVELRQTASRDLMVQIGQQVKTFFIA